MESQPQNSEFRNNSENFHPCIGSIAARSHYQMKQNLVFVCLFD